MAIVPAAGKAERFGGAKLTARVDGEPLLDRTLRSLLDGGVDEVVVVTAAGAAFDGVRLLKDRRVTRAENPDPSRGMFSSIQTGLMMADGDPVLVLPADMPFVRSDTVASIIAAARSSGRIVLPRVDGRHGHPVALPASLQRAILAAPPSSTLADLIKSHAHARIELDVTDGGVVRDVDRPGDLVP